MLGDIYNYTWLRKIIKLCRRFSYLSTHMHTYDSPFPNDFLNLTYSPCSNIIFTLFQSLSEMQICVVWLRISSLLTSSQNMFYILMIILAQTTDKVKDCFLCTKSLFSSFDHQCEVCFHQHKYRQYFNIGIKVQFQRSEIGHVFDFLKILLL